MNILELLKKEHDEARNLIKRLKTEPEVFEILKKELHHHAHAEEFVLYASMSGEIVSHGRKEHEEIEKRLEDVESALGRVYFLTKVGELEKAVEHHLKEEEEKLFPKAEEEFFEEELKDMGREYRELKP